MTLKNRVFDLITNAYLNGRRVTHRQDLINSLLDVSSKEINLALVSLKQEGKVETIGQGNYIPVIIPVSRSVVQQEIIHLLYEAQTKAYPDKELQTKIQEAINLAAADGETDSPGYGGKRRGS